LKSWSFLQTPGLATQIFELAMAKCSPSHFKRTLFTWTVDFRRKMSIIRLVLGLKENLNPFVDNINSSIVPHNQKNEVANTIRTTIIELETSNTNKKK